MTFIENLTPRPCLPETVRILTGWELGFLRLMTIGNMGDTDILNAVEPPPALPEPIQLDDLLAMDLPEVKWIHGDLTPFPGLIAISGRPGSQKTFFALWMALRASGGLPLFEDDGPGASTDRTPTLFIEEENTINLIRSRMKAFKRSPTPDLHFYIDQGFKMTDARWRTKILEFIDAKGIRLIFLDPFSSVMGLQDENSNAEVSRVMDIIRKEFIKRGISVIFIHHPSKNAEDGKNLRGAGDILGKCDVHLSLEKEADGKTILVTYEKMRVADETKMHDFRMCLHGDELFGGLTFKYLGEAKPKHIEEREALEKSILEVLGSTSLNQKEVALSCAVSATGDKFQAVWKRLVADKKIYQGTDRKWYLKMA